MICLAERVKSTGQIVGLSSTTFDGSSAATLWNGTGASNLGGDFSKANAINATGQVVGYKTISGNSYHATLWNGAIATDLGTLGDTHSEARGINDSGQVVGTSLTASNDEHHATLWNGTTATDLGYGQAFAINESGQVVGYSRTKDGFELATIWNSSTPTVLDTLGGRSSLASSINELGQVVGYSSLTINGLNHATLWSSDGSVIDLNTFLDSGTVSAGWVLIDASGINDSGWITGNTYNRLTGVGHAYLLSLAPVPEPETYVLMLIGLGFIRFITSRYKLG